MVYLADAAGTISALDAGGRLRWSATLDEPVQALVAGPSGVVVASARAGSLWLLEHDGHQRWHRLGAAAGARLALNAEENLYVSTPDGTLDALTPGGDLAWSLRVEPSGSPSTSGRAVSPVAVATDGTIIVSGSAGSVYAVARSGQVRWTHPIGGLVPDRPCTGPAELLTVASADGTLHALTPTGDRAWQYTPDYGGPLLGQPVISARGTIFVPVDDGTARALDQDGTQVWASAVGTSAFNAMLIGSGGTVYATAGHISALDDRDGATLWAHRLPAYSHGAMLLTREGLLVQGVRGGVLVALGTDGDPGWRFTVDDPLALFGTPAQAPDGTIIAAATAPKPYGTVLYALTGDGAPRWSYTPPEGHFSGDPAIGSDGTIYIRHEHDGLCAIRANGSLAWRFAAAKEASEQWSEKLYSNPAIGSDGTIYVGGDRHLYALAPDGEMRWRLRPTPSHSPRISALCLDAEGTIYFPVDYTRIAAVSRTGGQLWVAELGDSPDFAPERGNSGTLLMRSAPVVSNGMLIIGTATGTLYAIG